MHHCWDMRFFHVFTAPDKHCWFYFVSFCRQTNADGVGVCRWLLGRSLVLMAPLEKLQQ